MNCGSMISVRRFRSRASNYRMSAKCISSMINLTETKTVTGYKQEDALIIDIPNEALTIRGIIKLYIYLVSSEEGRTVNVAIMHVNRRMKPEGFEIRLPQSHWL